MQVAIVGLEHPTLGQEVAAFVVPAPGSVLDDAASHASSVDRLHGDDRTLDRLAASGDVRP
mgnify:CR=1 FL=1